MLLLYTWTIAVNTESFECNGLGNHPVFTAGSHITKGVPYLLGKHVALKIIILKWGGSFAVRLDVIF